MTELDHNYISDLVVYASEGDSNAFAELYAATYYKQYLFAFYFLEDELLARDALQETYILAFKELNTLNDTRLFYSWLSQINFRVCCSLSAKHSEYKADSLSASQEIAIGASKYTLREILMLPPSESQVIFLYYFKKLKLSDIAYVLDISRSSVKSFLLSGRGHLETSGSNAA